MYHYRMLKGGLTLKNSLHLDNTYGERGNHFICDYKEWEVIAAHRKDAFLTFLDK